VHENLILIKDLHSENEIFVPEYQVKLVFTNPTLEIYDDLQAMIMLDPVHDVDIQKGWPHKKEEQGGNK